MKHLGVDFGTKQVGLAVSNSKGSVAFCFDIVDNDKKLFNKLVQIIKEQGIEKVVVGSPNYKQNKFYDKTQSFIKSLQLKVSVDVVEQDELLTSVEASKRSDGKNCHNVAAQLILQDYLDKNK